MPATTEIYGMKLFVVTIELCVNMRAALNFLICILKIDTQ